MKRFEVIDCIFSLIKKNTRIISSVGYNSREVYQIRKKRKTKKGKDFLLVEGMGSGRLDQRLYKV